jgi:hypothetical protein
MTVSIVLTLAVVLLSLILLLARRVSKEYFRLRGTRVVACPETGQAAAVEVDMRSAALTASIGKPVFHLTACSRWPERHECGQECLRQVDAAPLDCLVRQQITAWYEGKFCALCGGSFGTIDGLTHQPALMSPGRVTVCWHEIDAIRLSDVLATYQPVCWNCHVAQTFRREHADLVLDNPWTGSAAAPVANGDREDGAAGRPESGANAGPSISV